MEFLFCSALLFAFTSISDCAFHPSHGSQQKGKGANIANFRVHFGTDEPLKG